jgi:hypothetical protein
MIAVGTLGAENFSFSTTIPAPVAAYLKLYAREVVTLAAESGKVAVGSPSHSNATLSIHGILKGPDLNVGSEVWSATAAQSSASLTCPSGTYLRGIVLANDCGFPPPTAGACDIQVLCTRL